MFIIEALKCSPRLKAKRPSSLHPTYFTHATSNESRVLLTMPPANEDTESPMVKAEYASPESTHIFKQSLPPLPSEPSTKEKTAYLSGLRSSVVTLQEDVNAFLTVKMEEDKTLASPKGLKVDEKKEEENYGEEVVEED